MDAGYLAESCSNTFPDGKWRGGKMREAQHTFHYNCQKSRDRRGARGLIDKVARVPDPSAIQNKLIWIYCFWFELGEFNDFTVIIS